MFKQILIRFGKGIAAAALAGVAVQATNICGIFPHIPFIDYCVPVLTGAILAAEKALNLTINGGK